MEMSPALFYLFVAVFFIAAELLILQLSVFWFLFFGIGALITSIVAWFFPELSWLVTTTLFLLASIATAFAFYPPLKRWQAKPGPIAGHDAIGQKVTVIQEISSNGEGKVSWSGSDWPAQTEEPGAVFAIGEYAVIKRLEGIRLIVGRE